jgi:pyruvate/2-oxoglutarate dehydrogenase complex dihydrolipoamide acyltransferase (E2) component
MLGSIHEGVKVEDGETRVTKKLKLCCTIDHRFLDGAQVLRLSPLLSSVALRAAR